MKTENGGGGEGELWPRGRAEDKDEEGQFNCRKERVHAWLRCVFVL